jgi:hypothetical protein
MVLAALPSLLTTLAGLARFSASITLISAVLVSFAGWLHLRGVRNREANRAYTRDPEMRRLLCTERRFAVRWIGCGLGLVVAVLFAHVPVVIALAALITLFTFANGVSIRRRVVAREAVLEPATVRRAQGGFRRRRIAPGRLLIATAVAAAALAGTAAGEVVVSERGHDVAPKKRRGGSGSGGDTSEAPGEGGQEVPVSPPTYAERCPALPDPLDIGHGLGELFRRVAAIKAGCGEREESVGGLGSVWFARGICSDQLQSLAVVSPGYTPAMLFGEAASFALEAAQSGELIFADVAEPAAGEVAAIGTGSGVYFFARSSPSLTQGGEEALNCSEIRAAARPFVLVSPPAASRWLCQLERSGWAWPVAKVGVEEISFQDYETGALVASEECRGGEECEAVAACEVPLPITLGELRAYMPPRIVE